jgi:LysR family glycine cleavage system transcriptional activator
MRSARPLPPLATFRAFEAAARRGNFVHAASELGVTPGAVSHHVRQLEAWIGHPLFERRANGVFVTDVGREFGAEVSALIERLVLAANRARERERAAKVAIFCQFSLAAKWLAPRLAAFRRRRPDIEVQLFGHPQDPDPRTYTGDLFIYFHAGPITGFEQTPIIDTGYIAVAAPALVAAAKAGLEPADLLDQPLIETTAQVRQWLVSWESWFDAAGVEGAEPRPGLEFNMVHLSLEACAAGAGFALTPEALVEDDVAHGRLVGLFKGVSSARHVYTLIAAEEKLRRPDVRAVRDWLAKGAPASEP